jgi:hypothetical protein
MMPLYKRISNNNISFATNFSTKKNLLITI